MSASSPAPQDFQLTTNQIDGRQAERALRAAYEGLNPRPGPWQRIQDSVAQVLERIGEMIERLLSGGSAVGRAIGWLALLGVLVALMWGGYWLLRRVGLVKEASTAPAAGRKESVDWRAAADRALNKGDLVEATRALYRQLLATLTAKGWLADRPGLTAGDCRRAARRIPGLYGEIEIATTSFENVAYGNRHASESEVEALRRAESLVAAAPGPPA